MLNIPHPKEFLEYAGGEKWTAVGTEFVWNSYQQMDINLDVVA